MKCFKSVFFFVQHIEKGLQCARGILWKASRSNIYSELKVQEKQTGWNRLISNLTSKDCRVGGNQKDCNGCIGLLHSPQSDNIFFPSKTLVCLTTEASLFIVVQNSLLLPPPSFPTQHPPPFHLVLSPSMEQPLFFSCFSILESWDLPIYIYGMNLYDRPLIVQLLQLSTTLESQLGAGREAGFSF